jgi:hypothetical protein
VWWRGLVSFLSTPRIAILSIAKSVKTISREAAIIRTTKFIDELIKSRLLAGREIETNFR